MKKLFIYIISLVAIFGFGLTKSIAQQREGDLLVNLDYQASFPLGGFKDKIIEKKSWRGFGGDIQYQISDVWGIGLAISYQDYYEKNPRKVYNVENTQQSMVLTNSVSVTPLLAKAKYYPLGKKHGSIQPYINGGLGLAVVDFQQYQGMYGSAYTSGRFAMQAGVGVSVPFGRLTSAGFHIGADFNYVNYNGRFYSENGQPDIKVNALNSLALKAGVHFPLR